MKVKSGSLVWSYKDKSAVDMIVLLAGVEYPFTASDKDPEEHGRILFEQAIKGDFGEIKEFPEA